MKGLDSAQGKERENYPEPRADVRLLYRSPVGRVLNYHCRQPDTGATHREYQSHSGAVFTRRGAYEYRVGRRSACVHSGLVLLENAGTERVVKHYGALRDDCTDIEFAADLLSPNARENRISIRNFKRLTIPITAELESLHALILAATQQSTVVLTLHVDLLLLDLLSVIARRHGAPVGNEIPFDQKKRDFYLENIDRAKNFMRLRFRENISLAAIARVAGISVFHFSRVFRTLTGYAPHRYLINLRLEHARALLRNTRLSVTEVCFDSGFASLEHFLAMFRKRFGLTPRRYKHVSASRLPCQRR